MDDSTYNIARRIESFLHDKACGGLTEYETLEEYLHEYLAGERRKVLEEQKRCLIAEFERYPKYVHLSVSVVLEGIERSFGIAIDQLSQGGEGVSNKAENEQSLYPMGTTDLEPVRMIEGKRYLWYSICSRHAVPDMSCELCQKGEWRSAREAERADERRKVLEEAKSICMEVASEQFSNDLDPAYAAMVCEKRIGQLAQGGELANER